MQAIFANLFFSLAEQDRTDQFSLAHDQFTVGDPAAAPWEINQDFVARFFGNLAYAGKVQIIKAGGVVMNPLSKRLGTACHVTPGHTPLEARWLPQTQGALYDVSRRIHVGDI